MRWSKPRRTAALVGLLMTGIMATSGATSAFGAATAEPVNPAVEAENYAKTLERQAIYLTPQYQAQLRTIGTENGIAALATQSADPERQFTTDLCWNGNDGCAGDVR